MKTHRYGESKPVSTGREFHKCIDCGHVDPVDNNTMANRYCFPKNEIREQNEANRVFGNSV